MSAVIQNDYPVRWMIRRDLLAVLQIEHASFEFAWTEEDFLTTLRNLNTIGHVAEVGNEIVGFMLYALDKDVLHVLDFAVKPTMRRSGVGVAMVQKLKNKLSQHGRNRIAVEVRETNLDAQLFFRSQGFSCTGTIRGWYEDTDEDAYVMEYSIH